MFIFKKGYFRSRYGKDTRYMTLRQKNIYMLRHHPVRTILLLPYYYLRASWDSVGIFMANAWRLVGCLIFGWFRIFFACFCRPVFTFLSLAFRPGLCCIPLFWMLAASSYLVVSGRIPVMYTKPFELFSAGGVILLDIEGRAAMWLVAEYLLSGWIAVYIILCGLLYGALSNLFVAAAVLFLAVITALVISEMPMCDFVKDVIVDPCCGAVNAVKESIRLVLSCAARCVPYWNLYLDDYDQYVHASMEHLLDAEGMNYGMAGYLADEKWKRERLMFWKRRD